MARNDGRGAVRSEVQAKQGGGSRLTLWVLVASLALAAIVGAFLFFKTDVVAPNRPAAVENPANPGASPAKPTTNP
jgi:hypothetical protein